MAEKKGEMKILGGRNLPPQWERFDKLQNRSMLLLGRGVSPKGVFRFHSHEEFETWKMNYRLKTSRELPSKTTSSSFAGS